MGAHGILETVPHCRASKRETLHFWMFPEGIFDTLILFFKKELKMEVLLIGS